MVQEQHTDEIDAFIRSLREKALERQRRTSIVETGLQETNRRLAEQHRQISRVAQNTSCNQPPAAFRAPAHTAQCVPPPTAPSPLPTAFEEAGEPACSGYSLLENLNVQPIVPLREEPYPEPVAAFETQAFTFPDAEVPVPEPAAAYQVPSAPTPTLEVHAGEPEYCLPDLSAMGVSWEPVGSFQNLVDEIVPEFEASPAVPLAEPPATTEATADFGFVRSQASHVFEPLGAPPLASGEEFGEVSRHEIPVFSPITPLPLKPLPAAALPLRKQPAPDPPKAQKPARPNVVKLPFLEEGASPQIQMIATAVQMAAKERHDRADRPLPKFATMSAYEETGGEAKAESLTENPKSKMKVTMAGPKKRLFWPFGNRKAA